MKGRNKRAGDCVGRKAKKRKGKREDGGMDRVRKEGNGTDKQVIESDEVDTDKNTGKKVCLHV